MIFDNIKNISQYLNLDENLKKGFDFILKNDLKSFENGKYQINGEKIYANIQEYETKANGLFEAHRKYIDIQYIVNGFEKIEVCEVSELDEKIPYDEKKDLIFFEGNGSFLKLKAGYFAVFFPQDGHKPCLIDEIKSNVKKVVVKVSL